MNIIDELVKTNSYKYNLKKSVEELLELAEVLMKKVNKKGGPKEPDNQKVIDELGDVWIRLEVLMNIFGRGAIQERIDKKLTQFEGYINENKYIGTI